jgi:uncharacterized repeat protein (TIGR03803 family)
MRPCTSSPRPSALLTAFVIFVFALTLLLSASAFGQTVTTLQNFNGTNGENPFLGALVQGRDGKLYGTTYGGGANSLGTVYRFNQATNFIDVIHSFAGSDGSSPAGGLILGVDGNFYGTTNYGGSAGYGVLFKITSAGTYTVLHSFLGGSDGEYPGMAPIYASDGNLYGATDAGQGVQATIYKWTRAGVYSVIYTFDYNTTGDNIEGLMQGSDGLLYATADTGAVNGCGSIVKLTLAGVLKGTHSFNCDNGGGYPLAALVQASNGNRYGTTTTGGTGGYGVLFSMGASFGESVLYDFSAAARDPQAGLMLGTDGNLYGVSEYSGAGPSEIYSWNPTTSAYSTIYEFASGIGYLSAPLMQHTSGLFYGPSWVDGAHNDGFLYSLNMGLGPFVAFVYPRGTVGSTVQILGQGLTGTTSVTFNGLAATSFTVVSDNYLTAVVPTGATNGAVVVTTPGGPLTSNASFTVSP